jgi:hypothetical protein
MLKSFVSLTMLVACMPAFALDVCQEGPHAIQSFAQARDAGVPQSTIMDSLNVKPGDDPSKNGFYADMARWVYRYPQFTPDQITSMLFRDCYGRMPARGLSFP